MISHYLASNPNFILFFLIGFSFAIGFSFWDSAKQGCLIKALYIYVFGAWVLSCLIVVFGEPSGQEAVLFGILVYHIKTVFSLVSTAFFWILEKNREWKQAEEKAKWEKEQAQRYQHQQANQQQDRAEQMRREQERREQEARQYRERQEQARREQEQQKSQQQKHQRQEKPKEPPPKKPEPARDTRTFEEILGLSSGWTQDDLKTAYKRESQRLHPDKWTGKPATIQAIMEAEFKAVQQAYNRLKR